MCHKYWVLVSTRTHPLLQENPLQEEDRALQLESSPHSPQLEKADEQQSRPTAAKQIHKQIF